MNVHEALEWALDCLASDDEVIGSIVTYTLNGVEMSRSTAYSDSLAQAKAALAASPRQGEPVEGLRDALERREALERLRDLDDKHFPTTRAKRPGWEVCDHDSMTWPCDTQKALDALEVIWPEILEAKLAAALSEPAEAVQKEKP